MDDPTVRIVLDDTSITPSELAGWVRRIAPNQYTTADALYIARCLIRGEGWEPPYYTVIFQLEREKNQPWTYTVTTPPNDMAIAFEKRSRLYAEGEELSKRGAAGDAEAAIEFCKRFQAGEMQNWCSG
jgi:hypothetical protein